MTFNWRLATRRFIFFAVIIIGIWDITAAAFGGADGTISLQGFCETGGGWHGKTLAICLSYIAGHVMGRIDK